jgi:hypothetical protein
MVETAEQERFQTGLQDEQDSLDEHPVNTGDPVKTQPVLNCF